MAKQKAPGLLPALARPDRYHHGDLRAALVSGAVTLLESSPGPVSLRTVAKSVGVSPAAVYHHFHDVRELLAAVAEQGFRELAAALTEVAREPGATLDRAVLVYLSFASTSPARYRAMFHAQLAPWSTFPSLEAAAELVDAGLADALAMGIGATTGARPPRWLPLATLHGIVDVALLTGAGDLALRAAEVGRVMSLLG